MKYYKYILSLLIIFAVSCSGNAELAQKAIIDNIPPLVIPPPEKDETNPELHNGSLPECLNLAEVRSSIVYPEDARIKGIEGIVKIKVLVGLNGSVIRFGKITGPDVFYDVVRKHARELKFTPAREHGRFVEEWVTVPFSFKLFSIKGAPD